MLDLIFSLRVAVFEDVLKYQKVIINRLKYKILEEEESRRWILKELDKKSI